VKKFLAVLLLLALLGISLVPALAAPVGQLNDLARYFPADTAVFVATRIDDGFFGELDSIVARIASVLPPGTIPPLTIEEALDMALAEADPPLRFQADIRTWLGDTAAVGVLEIPLEMGGMSSSAPLRPRSMDDDAPMLFAIAITNRDAAVTFFINTLATSDTEFTRTDEPDFTLLEDPNNPDAAVVIRDDVMLISNRYAGVTAVPETSLSADADFAATFDLLPETDYNATVYLNFGDILRQAMESDPEAAAAMGMFGGLFSAIGPQAWGATVLEGVSLTIDAVQRFDGLSVLEEMGIPASLTPINPAFAAHVPAGAPLVIHSTGLGTSIEALFTTMDRQMQALVESGMADDDELETMQEGLADLEAGFTTFTGLDLREDVASWMTGDYAMFLMLNPELNLSSQFGIFATFPLDFGLAVQATDPDAAAATVTGLTEALERLAALAANQEDAEAEVTISADTIGSNAVTVVTITSDEMPWPVELLLGSNNEVFALGTRNAVTAIFSRDGGLPANPAFVRAQNFLLPDPVSAAYLGTGGLLPLADLVVTFAEDDAEAEQNAQIVRDLLNLFPSATISQSMDADGNSFSRLVLTLAE
jgi:hypothetical protein